MLRDIYKELTGDACGARTTDEGELDKRITEALEMEDSDIIIDLWQHNIGRQAKYDVFWGKCSEFLQEPPLFMSAAMVTRALWQKPYRFVI